MPWTPSAFCRSGVICDLDHRVDLGRVIRGQPVGEARPNLAARSSMMPENVRLLSSAPARTPSIPLLSTPRILPTEASFDPRHVNQPGLGQNHRDPRRAFRRAADDLFLPSPSASTIAQACRLRCIRIAELSVSCETTQLASVEGLLAAPR